MVIINNSKYSLYTGSDRASCIFVDSFAHDTSSASYLAGRRNQLNTIFYYEAPGIRMTKSGGTMVFYVVRKDLICRLKMDESKGIVEPPCVIEKPSFITYWSHRFALKFLVKGKIKELLTLFPAHFISADMLGQEEVIRTEEWASKIRDKFNFSPTYGISVDSLKY